METLTQIEEIILQNDKRGVSELKPYIPNDFCTSAAKYLMDTVGDVIITTGLYTCCRETRNRRSARGYCNR